mmetsp:Transcript_15388/g.25119  ORF Transcript_15388/g.25119 Transcript_15388/m.25119 type:complete len:122 (-) Transcript_15388:213-578(-)
MNSLKHAFQASCGCTVLHHRKSTNLPSILDGCIVYIFENGVLSTPNLRQNQKQQGEQSGSFRIRSGFFNQACDAIYDYAMLSRDSRVLIRMLCDAIMLRFTLCDTRYVVKRARGIQNRVHP